eukprot:5280568-Prymnesium_polylepis.1
MAPSYTKRSCSCGKPVYSSSVFSTASLRCLFRGAMLAVKTSSSLRENESGEPSSRGTMSFELTMLTTRAFTATSGSSSGFTLPKNGTGPPRLTTVTLPLKPSGSRPAPTSVCESAPPREWPITKSGRSPTACCCSALSNVLSSRTVRRKPPWHSTPLSAASGRMRMSVIASVGEFVPRKTRKSARSAPPSGCAASARYHTACVCMSSWSWKCRTFGSVSSEATPAAISSAVSTLYGRSVRRAARSGSAVSSFESFFRVAFRTMARQSEPSRTTNSANRIRAAVSSRPRTAR